LVSIYLLHHHQQLLIIWLWPAQAQVEGLYFHLETAVAVEVRADFAHQLVLP
jgi:hypothetical protein